MLEKSMRKLLLHTMLAFLLAGCAGLPGKDEAHVDCQEEYAQLHERHMAILSGYEASPSEAQASLASLELDVLCALKSCSGEPLLLALMSNVLVNLGENKRALPYAKRAVALNPERWETNEALGSVLTFLGDHEHGLAYLSEASRLAPENIYLRFNICSEYEMAKQYHKAVGVCTEVIESGDPKVTGPALYVRARAYEGLGELDKAKLDFKKSKEEGFNGARFYSKEHLEEERIE
jgi:tetratricopeptide (TPR) repeat protein